VISIREKSPIGHSHPISIQQLATETSVNGSLVTENLLWQSLHWSCKANEDVIRLVIQQNRNRNMHLTTYITCLKCYSHHYQNTLNHQMTITRLEWPESLLSLPSHKELPNTSFVLTAI